jgi:hypothetical protein
MAFVFNGALPQTPRVSKKCNKECLKLDKKEKGSNLNR